MKRSLLPALFGVAVLVAGLNAQEKPNFVGTWKLADAASADMFTPTQMAVVQEGNTLTVTTTGQMGEIKTTYNMDGTEARSPLDINGTTVDRVTKCAWDGGKLVLTAKSEMNGQLFEFKSVWSLGSDGALLIEMTYPDFQGGGGPITAKATYKKA